MLDFDAGNVSDVAGVLLRHIDSPRQYRVDGRAVLSNWRGRIDWDVNHPMYNGFDIICDILAWVGVL